MYLPKVTEQVNGEMRGEVVKPKKLDSTTHILFYLHSRS